MIAKKGKKSSNGNLVSRLGLIVSPSHAKPGLISRLELALSKGARLGKDIAVGFNSVNKVLEEMNARTRNAASNSSFLVPLMSPLDHEYIAHLELVDQNEVVVQ